MELFRRIDSSTRPGDQGRQDRPETSTEREKRHTRFLRLATHDSPFPSTSDTHPMTVAALDHTRQETDSTLLRRMASYVCWPYNKYYAWEQGIRDANQRLAEELSRQSEQRKDRERMHNAGQLLGINVSEVRLETWAGFCAKLLVEHENFGNDEQTQDVKDSRLLGDILYGGKTEHVSDEQREREEYQEMKQWVLKKWEESEKSRTIDESTS